MRIGKFPWGSPEGVPEGTLGIRPSIPKPHSRLEMTVTRGPGGEIPRGSPGEPQGLPGEPESDPSFSYSIL